MHEFSIVLAGAKAGETDYDGMTRHYQRALELSKGKSAGLYVTYAEAMSVPHQQKDEFQRLLEKSLSVSTEDNKDSRLLNELAQRRARWLLERIDDLILISEENQARKEN